MDVMSCRLRWHQRWHGHIECNGDAFTKLVMEGTVPTGVRES